MKITVWTEAYSPWIMGGDVHAPISTKLEVGEPVDLGKGFRAYVVDAPNGDTYIAESETGAFVGNDLGQVKQDVEEAAPAVMRQQIAEAKQRAKKARPLTPERFWGMFRK